MPLKKVRVEFYIPAELAPLIHERTLQEHYSSESAYCLGLVLFDLTARRRHWLTSQVLSEPPEVLDKVVEEIVREFPNAPSMDGGWFRGRVQAILDDYGKSVAERPPRDLTKE